MPHRSAKVKEELKRSKLTQWFAVSHACLDEFPAQALQNDDCAKLRRVDVSSNNISSIPREIKRLTNVRELWLSHNPVSELPVEIGQLTKLEVLDIRYTNISYIPPEVANLENLYEIDWRETPLEKHLSERYGIQANNLKGLRDVLVMAYERKRLEEELFEVLMGEHFAQEADKPFMKEFIDDLVRTLSDMYEDLHDFKIFVHRADNLLPEKTTDVNPTTLQQTKENFIKFRRDTTKQRLGADVEIKIRNIYFDRIERPAVEVLLRSIYEHVHSLEDIQFLIKYASEVLPPIPADANGAVVWDNILQLQDTLTAKREAAINSVRQAMEQLYPEQKPEELRVKAYEVAAVFQKERFATKRELNSLSQIAADATKIFPPDFLSVNPAKIQAKAIALYKRS